jgi:predicted nucleotidyltransferase
LGQAAPAANSVDFATFGPNYLAMADVVEKRSLRHGKDLASVVATLKANSAELRQAGVTAMVLFGSRVRGDARPDSDLDVMIDYDTTRPFTLYDLLDVQDVLERLTLLKAHVVTRDGFRPDRLRRVMENSISVF